MSHAMSHPGDRASLELSVRQVRDMLDDPARAPILIDCREDSEWRTARIQGARLVPLGQISAHAEHLAAESEEQGRLIVVHCHHGVRSLKAAAILRAHGADAKSMAGGIEAWSVQIDPAVPRY
jgi:rhodanese-related sulfurtransferase